MARTLPLAPPQDLLALNSARPHGSRKTGGANAPARASDEPPFGHHLDHARSETGRDAPRAGRHDRGQAGGARDVNEAQASEGTPPGGGTQEKPETASTAGKSVKADDPQAGEKPGEAAGADGDTAESAGEADTTKTALTVEAAVETPVSPTPAGATPADAAPADAAPEGETPAGETPAGETPVAVTTAPDSAAQGALPQSSLPLAADSQPAPAVATGASTGNVASAGLRLDSAATPAGTSPAPAPAGAPSASPAAPAAGAAAETSPASPPPAQGVQPEAAGTGTATSGTPANAATPNATAVNNAAAIATPPVQPRPPLSAEAAAALADPELTQELKDLQAKPQPEPVAASQAAPRTAADAAAPAVLAAAGVKPRPAGEASPSPEAGRAGNAQPTADSATRSLDNPRPLPPQPPQGVNQQAALAAQAGLQNGLLNAHAPPAGLLRLQGLSPSGPDGSEQTDFSIAVLNRAAADGASTLAQAVARGDAPHGPNGPNGPATQVAVQIARFAGQGLNRFSIRLDPPELGRVDIKLDIARDGKVRAHLTVDRPEALDALQRDARTLERALADAGLDARDGGLKFTLRDHGSGGGADSAHNEHNGEDESAGHGETHDNIQGEIHTGHIAADSVDIRV